MSLKSALEIAKNEAAEKVPFRFQFPVTIKQEFEDLCNKHQVSMTDMILGLIKSALEEDKGLSDSTTLSIINKIESLEKQYTELEKTFNLTEEDILECENGEIVYLTRDMENLKFRISVLTQELKTRSK